MKRKSMKNGFSFTLAVIFLKRKKGKTISVVVGLSPFI